jgi:flagella basal body P-ring formation protein FlgA
MSLFRNALLSMVAMPTLFAGAAFADELPAGPLRDALNRRYPHAQHWKMAAEYVAQLPAQYEVVRAGRRSAVRGRDGVTVWVDVRGVASVAVVDQPVAKRALLSLENLSWEVRDVTTTACVPVASLPDRAPCIVTRPYHAGETLCASDLRPVPVVARGQRIVVQVRVAGVSVEAEGIAQGDALAGERVSVRAIGGELLVGVAQYPGRVVVDAI